MPDIDPTTLSRPGPLSQSGATPTLSTKSLSGTNLAGSASGSSQKQGKGQMATNAGTGAPGAPRIELEPLYTGLKAAVGDHWADYKEAIGLFMLGQLNQAELSTRIDYYITTDPLKEHLHNQLLNAIYGNISREPPDTTVAGWVSANDKPSNVSKPLTGDGAEHRLKTEIMQLPPRDRRRLKLIPESDNYISNSNMLAEYHQAKQIKLPEIVPTSAGGLNTTNWDLEIHKRYSQPLASETFEFPEPSSIALRMTPICYEEGLSNGASNTQECASYLSIATEVFVKEILNSIFGRTRCNGPQYIMTARYKRQLEREEELWLRGDIKRDANGLLPVERDNAGSGGGVSMGDLQLALEMGGFGMGMMPLVVEKIVAGYMDGELEEEEDRRTRAKTARTLAAKKRAPRVGPPGGPGVPPATARPPNGDGVDAKPATRAENIRQEYDLMEIDDDDPWWRTSNGVPNTTTLGTTTAANSEDILPGPVDEWIPPAIAEDAADDDWGWEGGGAGDRLTLGNLLDDCLAVGQ
ncbi:hypothetical protein L228DRAFT_35361 [Xylona heveae TC161]|uniref:Transcriptional co-activator n=1 Tax=Xylona heveae (strain CBS 132557 / TC161) TaxID=1328760 RepID=A0A165A855_XYLHT|nr:hypothetical protein L228DRAFT_35361 [Xylona heveae TC161]KZF20087.1 hypothetical protein L228DRAFT_35361 [Xylona heveae TC161]